MRFYSLVDLFNEPGTALVDLTDHEIDNQLDAVWSTFTDPIAQIKPSTDGVFFGATQTAAKTGFSEFAADGFKDQFRFRFTQNFSQDAGSAGQMIRHILVDDSDQGYIIQMSTDGGDNTSFTYEVQEYDAGALTPIAGLTDTINTPGGRFNLFVTFADGQLTMTLDLNDTLSAAAPNNHEFSEYKFNGNDPADTETLLFHRVFLLGSLVDPVFTKEYTDLLIKQYHEKPKAFDEIKLGAKSWSETFSFMNEVPEEFDVDTAIGAQLNIISKQVFGFIARSISGTGETLSDEDLRFFINAKIAKNNASSFMTSDESISIQDVIQLVFEGAAYVVDGYDMTLTLYIDQTVDIDLVVTTRELGLLPSGQGVRYRAVVLYTVGNTFGFNEINPDAKTWDDKFTPADDPGLFAQKVF